MPRLTRVFVRAVPLASLGFAVVLCSGCGGGVGVVSGKVTVNGKPLERGSITFLSEVGNKDPFTASIQDGEYRTDLIPVGTTKIYVLPPMDLSQKVGGGDLLAPPPKAQEGGGLPPGRGYFHDRYTEAGTSGLEYTVKKGENTHDINLDPAQR